MRKSSEPWRSNLKVQTIGQSLSDRRQTSKPPNTSPRYPRSTDTRRNVDKPQSTSQLRPLLPVPWTTREKYQDRRNGKLCTRCGGDHGFRPEILRLISKQLKLLTLKTPNGVGGDLIHPLWGIEMLSATAFDSVLASNDVIEAFSLTLGKRTA